MSTEQIYNDVQREHIEELCAAYTLGALSEDEAGLREFEGLVESGDPYLSKTLEKMLAACSILALAVPLLEPPVSARAALLEHVEKISVSQNGSTSRDDLRKPAPSEDAVKLKRRTRFYIFSSLAATSLLCVLLAMNVSKSAKLDRSNDLMKALLKQTDSLRQNNDNANIKSENDSLPLAGKTSDNDGAISRKFIAMFAENDARLVTLASAPLGSARQHLFFSPKQKTIAILRETLRPLDPNKSYVLWATVGNRSPVAVGSFKVDSQKNSQVISIPTKLRYADSFAISIENGTDATEQKGKIIFVGNVPKTGIN